MASTAPLTGSELIDFAKANGPKGREAAADRCGYGSDLAAFENALKAASNHLGLGIHSFDDLVNPPGEERMSGVQVGDVQIGDT